MQTRHPGLAPGAGEGEAVGTYRRSDVSPAQSTLLGVLGIACQTDQSAVGKAALRLRGARRAAHM